MSNFLVVQADADRGARGREVFQKGLSAAGRLLQIEPAQSVALDCCHVATFPRANGTPTPFVHDERRGMWLVAAGTWFHRDGMASGVERELLARYVDAGAEALASELEGFFCILIGDTNTKHVVVITDIIGSFHVFARPVDGLLTLSGSSLLLAALAPARLDRAGCQEFLRTGIVYDDRSFYADVRKIGPAAVNHYWAGSPPSSQSYWDVGAASAKRLDRDAAVEALWSAATSTGRRIGRVFPRIVCDLTGGYDSRALVGAMRASGVRFETTVSGPPESPDVTVSQGLAEIVGVRHQVLANESPDLDAVRRALAFTDGEYDLVEYARILAIHSRLMKRYDVSLNGSFGEVARGYWWELLWPRVGARERLDARRVAAGRFAVEHGQPTMIPEEQRLDLVAHFANVMERAGRGLAGCANTAQLDNVYLQLRMQRWQGRIASSTNRLWPCLSPFMFRSVLEAMLAASPRVRRHSYLVRRMLAVHHPELARYPLEHGFPAAPFSLTSAHRFLPVVGHLAGKVWNRARRQLGIGQHLPTGTSSTGRLNGQIAAKLDPATMRLGTLYGRDALQSYVEALAGDAAVVPASRVYSIECALRALAEVDAPCTI